LKFSDVGPIDLQDDYHKRLTEMTQTDSGGTGDTQVVDGSKKIQLWKDAAGGKSRGRCYGTGHLVVNLRHGITPSFDGCSPFC
jgi:hypothetical protein